MYACLPQQTEARVLTDLADHRGSCLPEVQSQTFNGAPLVLVVLPLNEMYTTAVTFIALHLLHLITLPPPSPATLHLWLPLGNSFATQCPEKLMRSPFERQQELSTVYLQLSVQLS
jgi:hypothetical protein